MRSPARRDQVHHRTIHVENSLPMFITTLSNPIPSHSTFAVPLQYFSLEKKVGTDEVGLEVQLSLPKEGGVPAVHLIVIAFRLTPLCQHLSPVFELSTRCLVSIKQHCRED